MVIQSSKHYRSCRYSGSQGQVWINGARGTHADALLVVGKGIYFQTADKKREEETEKSRSCASAIYIR